MLYIRVDMNAVIATGHVMRCIAIADAVRALGEETTFILADEQAVQLLEARGYHYIVLHTAWDHMDEEMFVLEAVIKEQKITALFVDSYQVTKNYLERLSKLVRVAYLDDLDAFAYPVDALICYANYWKNFSYADKTVADGVFLGSTYTPLRREFSGHGAKEIKPQVENLLLLSGGTDSYNVLAGLLAVIDTEKYQHVDVICGKYYPNYDALCKTYADRENVHIHQAVSDMIHYMEKADLAVSAGGTTLYELCACGTPTISYALADNQLDNVRQFAADEMIDYAGDVRYEGTIGNIACIIEDYYSNYEERKKRSRKMQGLVDGKGAQRIAQMLMDMC